MSIGPALLAIQISLNSAASGRRRRAEEGYSYTRDEPTSFFISARWAVFSFIVAMAGLLLLTAMTITALVIPNYAGTLWMGLAFGCLMIAAVVGIGYYLVSWYFKFLDWVYTREEKAQVRWRARKSR